MIVYNRKLGIVTVTADNGVTRGWPLAEFEADPAGCAAQTGNGITSPPREPTAEDKLAELRADLDHARHMLAEISDASVKVALALHKAGITIEDTE